MCTIRQGTPHQSFHQREAEILSTHSPDRGHCQQIWLQLNSLEYLPTLWEDQFRQLHNHWSRHSAEGVSLDLQCLCPINRIYHTHNVILER